MSAKLFVGNLSFQTTQDDLFAAFSQFGSVERVNIVTDRDSGQSRGFAFVKFFAVEAAQLYMEQYYPTVQIGESRVKIAYSLGRGEEDNGWTCQQV